MSTHTRTPTKNVASSDEIHRSVRERYASIARSGQVGCCEEVIGLVESAAGVKPGASGAQAAASDCCGPDCCEGESLAQLATGPAAKALSTVLEQVEAAACCNDDCCSPAAGTDAAANASTQAADEGVTTESSQSNDTMPNILGLGCGDPLLGAGVEQGQRVVDLGSGAGGDALRVAERCGPTGEVVGVDMTPEMLDRARANAARAGVDNVRFVEGFIESLPLESESADWIISNCVINLAPDKAPVFAEIARVLRPGGRLSVADIVRPEGAETSLPAPGERWSSCIDGAMAVDAYRAGLESAGLVNVEIEAIGAVHKAIELTRSGLPFSARIRAQKPA